MTTMIIKKAKEYCDQNGARLTDPRHHVLEIIGGSKKPLTAYEVLEKLGSFLDKPKPPTAYRAIEFWEKAGFIHRIESLNSYVACSVGHHHSGSQFMICDDCGDVSEAHLCSIPESLKTKTDERDFKPSFWSVELHGQCSDCR